MVQLLARLKADAVAEGHLAQRLAQALHAQGVDRLDLAGVDQALHLVKDGAHALIDRQAVLVVLRREVVDLVARRLKLVGDDLLRLCGGDGEGDECRRNVDVLKGTGHRVLAADGRAAKLKLCLQAAQQRLERFAPLDRVGADLLKIFLEAQPAFFAGTAGSDDLRNRFDDRKLSALKLIFVRNIWVKAPGHHRAGVGLAVQDGDLGDHRLGWGQLGLAAVRHHHGARTDGRVEPVGQAALGADV